MTAAPSPSDFRPATPADFRPCAVRLPHRALTEEEQHGFRIACGVFATWARQLMVEAAKLPPLKDADAVASAAPMSVLGQKMLFMAEALDLTLGQHGK